MNSCVYRNVYITRPKYRHWIWRCMQNPNLLTALACNLLWKIIWQLQMLQSKNNIHRLVDLLSYQSYPKRAKAKKKKRSKSPTVGNFAAQSHWWMRSLATSWVNLIIKGTYRIRHKHMWIWLYDNQLPAAYLQSSIKITRPCTAQIWSVWCCRNLCNTVTLLSSR